MEKKESHKRTWLAIAALWVMAGILSAVSRNVPGFATFYATKIYPVFTRTVGRLIGLLPFSVVEMALYVMIVAVAASICMRIRIGTLCRRMALLGGILVLSYVAFCGINYHRDTLAESAGFVLAPSSVAELEELCAELVARVNSDAGLVARNADGVCVPASEKTAVVDRITSVSEATAAGSVAGTDGAAAGEATSAGSVAGTDGAAAGEATSAGSVAGTDGAAAGEATSAGSVASTKEAKASEDLAAESIIGIDYRRACVEAMNALGERLDMLQGPFPMPKPVLVWQILSYQQVTGVYSPFTLEANYNRDIPFFTLPFTICHELSHLKGFMREDEANFAGWLACASSADPQLRYSGNLTAYITVGNALYAADREAWERAAGGLCEEAWADLRYNNEYWTRFEGKAAEVHEKANDAYLKANGQSDGVRSYGRMVDLMLAWRRAHTEG